MIAPEEAYDEVSSEAKEITEGLNLAMYVAKSEALSNSAQRR